MCWHVENRTWEVPPRSLFFTLPWQVHGSVKNAEEGVELFYVILPTDPPVMNKPAPIRLHTKLRIPPKEGRSLVETMKEAGQPFIPAKAPLPFLFERIVSLRPGSPEPVPTKLALYAGTLLLETVDLIRSGARHTEPDFARKTVAAFLDRLRINRARTLLLESDRTITDIAYLCGFHDSTYFSRVFRDFEGMSARRFRQTGRHSRKTR